jgi:1-acyl-sn-glycerol-3-phosphate acyltransferase
VQARVKVADGLRRVGERGHGRGGEPLRVEHYADREDDRLVLRQVTDELMYEIRELSGYEYVDTYATKKKDETDNPEQVPDPAIITRIAS